MRFRRLIALCSMLFALQSFVPLSAQDTLSQTLGNGLKVNIIRTPYNQYAQVIMLYNVGYGHEIIENAGVARVIFEAFDGKTKNSREYYPEVLAKMYGHSSKELTASYTLFQTEVTYRNLEKAIQLESERMYNLDLNKDWIKRCYDKARLGKNLGKDDYKQQYLHNFNKIALADNHELLEKEVYAPVDVNTAEEFYKKYFSPLRTQLTIVSNLDPKTVLLIVEKYFKNIAKENYPVPRNEVISELKSDFNIPKINFSNYKTLLWANPYPVDNDTLKVCYYYLSRMMCDGELSYFPNRLKEYGIACLDAFHLEYANAKFPYWAIQGIMVKEKDYKKSMEILNSALGELLYRGILYDDIQSFLQGLRTKVSTIQSDNKSLAYQVAMKSYQENTIETFVLQHPKTSKKRFAYIIYLLIL
jgi:hypothetical protein